MLNFNKKQILLFLLFLIIPTITALTLEEYADTLDTSFYDGTLNITVFSDSIIDSDSDGDNDTISFSLTTDNATSANFTANVFFEDENLPVLTDNQIISSSNSIFYMNLSTYYLTESVNTYFVRIYNSIGQVVYESSKKNTSNYTNYETGTNITQITDANINNNYIQVNLTLNVTRNETVNITVNLEYNDSIICGIKQVNLTTPSQNILVQIDNETIKSTHYNGVYGITVVKIGDKIIETQYNTSSYNYETFAKTSYIQNIVSRTFDNNSNNLSEALEFNFTLNIKSTNNYTIEADLYDSANNYITSLTKNESLNTGTQTVEIIVKGEDIYSTYYNGEFKLTYVKISIGNETKDIIYDAYTTDVYYYNDFERPPLPDLTITMNTTYSTGTTNITINITNEGTAPAFNIFVDLFDNNTYENQSSTAKLDINESQIFNYVTTNISEDAIIVAIVDFNNYVDESNESNNIADNVDDVPIVILENPQNNTLSTTGNITFNCSATDDQGLLNITLYTNISGTWQANETKNLRGISNSTTFTINNIVEGNYMWNCFVYDNNNQSEWATINYTFKVNILQDIHKIFFRNSSGSNVAWWGDEGNMILKGTCTSGGTCDSPPPNSFLIQNSTGNTTAYIDTNGNLCLETGDCSDESASCNPTNDAFIIQNVSGHNMSYIDETGDLCLTGILVENGNP